MNGNELKCELCCERLAFAWSDTHGVGVCCNCGLPYVIIHYEKDANGESVRVEKPPEIAVRADWMPTIRRFWEETHSRVAPGGYDCGFIGEAGRNGRTYSGATHEHMRVWGDWLDAHKADLPKPVEETVAESSS